MIIGVTTVPDIDTELEVNEDAVTIELQEHNLQRLVNGVSLFVFRKKDGTLRKSIGTLNPNTIPKEKGEEAKRYHKPAPHNQTFYDLQTNEFRSYNVDSIVALIDF